MSLTAAQLEQRKTLLTASDVPAVLGVNPYRSPLDVWLRKVEGAEAQNETWRSRRGHAVEPIILQAIAEAHHLRVVRCAETYTHPILTWLGATPDADAFMVPDIGKPELVAIAEAKDVGLRMVRHWRDPETDEDVIPEYVLVQTQVQMTVRRVKRALVGRWLATEDEPTVTVVDHDAELEAVILDGCSRFWNDNVLARKPPEPRTPQEQAEIVRALFPKHKEGVFVPSDAEMEMLAGQFIAAREAKKAAEKEVEELGARFKHRLGEAEGVAGQGWRALFKYREGYEVPAHSVKGQRVLDVRTVKPKKEK